MDLSRSILIYACFITLEIKSEILRLPCKSYANFSIIKHDTVLQGSVIETLLFLTENQCKSKCLMEHRCKSYNKENGGDLKCELNDKTTEDWRDWSITVVSRPGWTFKSTNYSFPLLGQVCEKQNPCSKDEICKDTCELPGYQCLPCEAWKTGHRCDNDKYPLQGSGSRLIQVGAKGDQFASVTVLVPHGKYKIKLVHHSGFLRCSQSTPADLHKTTFGCFYLPWRYDKIEIIITDNQNNVLLPKENGYTHDGNISKSQFIIFSDVIELYPGQQLRFWYKQDLENSTENNNDGTSKFYAYALLQQKIYNSLGSHREL